MPSLLRLLVTHAHAQVPEGTTLIPDGSFGAGCNFATGEFTWSCFPLYIQYLANVIVGFTIAICLLVIMYNGYRYALGPVMGEGGNENAKKGILFGLIGTGIALLAYLIVDTVFVALTNG